MIVKCEKIINVETNLEESGSNWVSIGKEYVVLNIFASPAKQVKFTCQSDDNYIPVLMGANQFVIVSNRIPEIWVAEVDKLGNLSIGPGKWLRKGFWEDYFDGDTQAIQDYESELTKILATA